MHKQKEGIRFLQLSFQVECMVIQKVFSYQNLKINKSFCLSNKGKNAFYERKLALGPKSSEKTLRWKSKFYRRAKQQNEKKKKKNNYTKNVEKYCS